MLRIERFGSVAVLAVLALISGTSPPPAEAADTISVGGLSGGIWAESFRAAILEPFGKVAQVQVKSEEGISGVTLAKMRQQRDNPQFDIVYMDRGISDQAIREGLVEPVEPASLTHMADVIPEAFVKDKKGQIMAVSLVYWGIGIAYNTKEIKQVPSSWLDLAKPDYKGRLGVYSTDNSIAFPMLVTLAELKGGGVANMDPAFKMVSELGKQGAVFFGGSVAGGNLLSSGEVSVATLASTQVWDLQSKGFPIAYAVPKEGCIANDIRMHIVKGTKNKAMVEKLLDFSISKSVQEDLTGRLLTAPVNTKVSLPDEVRAKLPWGPGGSVAKLRLVDGEVILDHKDEWAARWNKEVVK
jgi:putative spermidine/putrescine transport system substrate-binding protein